MTRKILMTGATGFVGRELGVELARRGYEIHALTRDPERVRGTLPFPATLHALDAERHAFDARALEGCAAVVNLAGEPVMEGFWTKPKKRRIRTSRIDATRALTATIRSLATPPPVYVQASAIGYYGDRGDEILTEDAAPGDDFLAKVCVDWEKEGLAVESAGVRAVALRIGLVLGHTGGALPKISGIYHKGLGGILGSGKQWVSWIHIDDLVRLLVHAIERDTMRGPVNATAPDPCRYEQFHEALGAAIGRPGGRRVPELALRTALGEKAVVALASARVMPVAAEGAGFTCKWRKIDLALSNLFSDAVERGASRVVVKQWLPKPVDQVWPFFADAANLERLTPPWLAFHVVHKSTPALQDGTVIDYRLRLRGLPLKWQSRIDDWTPGAGFVDSQVRGPYKLWHHTHRFESLAGGSLITDSVQYRLPLGSLGGLVAGALVDRDVGKIFQFRQKAVAREFGGG